MTQATHRRAATAIVGLAVIFARPRAVAIACVVILAAAGWIYLGLMVADMIEAEAATRLGPGMGLLDVLRSREGLDTLGQALWDAMCRPTFGNRPHFGMPASGAWGVADAALVLAMWCAMALAMMLPSAAPMIMTYSDIAEAAARKGEPVVSPLVLAAGYVGVWLAFALGAMALQWGLNRAALLDHAMASTSGLFSGAIFVAAGLYQFSALKHACVTQCQRPFPFFFANWTTEPRGVLRLGIRQGLFCLGCCWAMMVVMFAVGLMNVVWMAALGAIMTTEKIATTTRFSRAIGAVLIAIGVAVLLSSIAAHWPTRSA